MGFIEFKNNENLVAFMLAELRLSRIDYKFLENIQSYTKYKKQITTNQNELFKKIVSKYHRQFVKKELFLEKLLELNWNCNLVPSSPLYTEAYLSVQDGKIYLKSPYNKDFVNENRKKPIYSMLWNKDNRQYEVEFSTTAFRDLTKLVGKYFPSYNLCDTLTEAHSHAERFKDIKFWDPSLVVVNGRLIIVAANSFLLDAISHIELNYSLNTLATLSTYGIKIDRSVVNYILETTNYTKEQINFAVTFDPVMERKDMDQVLVWLKELECDAIVSFFRDPTDSKKITDYGITCYNTYENKVNTIPELRPVLFNFRSFDLHIPNMSKMFKVVRFVNSQPIDIK